MLDFNLGSDSAHVRLAELQHIGYHLLLSAAISASCHESFMSCVSCLRVSSQFFLHRPGLLLYALTDG